MTEDIPTNPEGRIPSAAGIVATAGKEPIPLMLDLNRDGILDYEQKWFRSSLAQAAYWLIGFLFPKAAQSQVLQQAMPHIEAIIQTGAK